MTKPIRISARIPFPGFYGSSYDDALDRESEQYCEWTADEDNGRDDDEARQPPELRLNAAELSECIYWAFDSSEPHRKMAQWHTDAFSHHFKECFGVDLALVFEETTSPREYNFETDRLFATVPLKTVKAMFAASKAEGHATLREVIDERHSSRSGFMSFYKTDLTEWTSKPRRDWDHNEVETLIRATAIRVARASGDYDAKRLAEGVESDYFRREVEDYVIGDDGASQAWEAGMNWATYEEKREEARQAKLDALEESDPEAWALLTKGGQEEPSFRCVLTNDLFDINSNARA